MRHFEPLISLFGFLLSGCGHLVADASRGIKTTAAVALLVGTALVATSDAMSEQEHWELQGESLGLLLHQAFGAQQPLLSSDASGVVPFFAHVPVLDPLGLNDYHIAHETQRLRGHGWVGHELGDGKYILDQKPDLLLFRSLDGKDALLPADEQIVQDPRFQQYYQPVRFDTPQPNSIRALMYLRRIDGKLGLQRSGNNLLVPGYLAKVDLQNSVHMVDGKATLVIAAKHQTVFEQLPVEPGSWKLQLDSDQPLVLVQPQGAERVPGCDFCLITTTASPVSLTLSNQTDAPVSLKSLTLSPR